MWIMQLTANSQTKSSENGLDEMKPSIIGVGSTTFREHWHYGLREMIRFATSNALKSANIELKEIDSLFVANCFGSTINGQNNINALCSDELGIQNSVAISGGDAAGAYAIVQAANSILSKQNKISLVIGVEKMSDMPITDMTKIVSEVTEQEYEASTGATLASLYAMITLIHMKLYGTTNKQLSMVSIKNHSNAVENEIAQFRFKVAMDDIAKSPMVADPIRLLHSAPHSDGCCALIMCNEEMAKKYKDKIQIIGTGIGADFMAVHEREDITTFNAVSSASKTAIAKAGIKIEDISFAEIHDSFSIGEIISLEDIGFAKKGTGGKFVEEGNADLYGKIPINPSGGLKGCGHPFAATGIRQAIESFYQLNGTAGKRQVKNPKYALTENISGTGATAVVNIYSL